MSLVGSKVLVEGGGNKKWCKKYGVEKIWGEKKNCRPAMFIERGVL